MKKEIKTSFELVLENGGRWGSDYFVFELLLKSKNMFVVLFFLFLLLSSFSESLFAESEILTPVVESVPIAKSSKNENTTKVSQSLTPFSKMTKSEYQNYLKTQQENGNFNSASKQSMEQETEDVKNHKVRVHPYTPKKRSKIIINPPTSLNIEPGNGMVRLSWDSVQNAVDYCVYISKDGINFKKRVFGTNKKNKVIIDSLKKGESYYFGVSSIGLLGSESEKKLIETTLKK